MARNPHASYESSDHQRMPILPQFTVMDFYSPQVTVGAAGLTNLVGTDFLEAGTYLVIGSVMLGGTAAPATGGILDAVCLYQENTQQDIMAVYPYSKAYTFTTVATIPVTRLFLRVSAVSDTIAYRDARFNYLKIMKLK